MPAASRRRRTSGQRLSSIGSANDQGAITMTPTLESLGHGTFTQNGRQALGSRPLLIVLGEYSNFPPFNSVHSLDYYERLGFGTPTPPFSTDHPTNPASLRE